MVSCLILDLFFPIKTFYILHVGTNDITLNDTPEEITEHIVNVAKSFKTENNTVVISNIVPRGNSKGGKRKGGSS